MKIYGIEKLSMVDFNGHLCCTIFTAGCNFKCPFCQNADLVKMQNLNEITQEELFAYLNKRKGVIDSVCVSGGEPTIYPELPEFLKKLKDLNLLVKLDTNGTNFEMLEYVVKNKLVDYVAMDIKNSQQKYFETAGIDKSFSLKNILKSVQFLKQDFVPYEFRTTLVKNYHTLSSIQDMAIWLDGAEKLYLQCFVDGGTCLKSGLEKVDKNEAEEFKNILEQKIKHVELRGY